MGHFGYMPLSIYTLGGQKIQGKDVYRTIQISKEVYAFQEAGCFSIVLEMIPKQFGEYISKNIEIPRKGIDTGKFYDE